MEGGRRRFFEKILPKKFAFRVFFVSLQPQNGIGVWCNGNTTDSGPVIPGSNPGTPTQSLDLGRGFFISNLGIITLSPSEEGMVSNKSFASANNYRSLSLWERLGEGFHIAWHSSYAGSVPSLNLPQGGGIMSVAIM